MTIIIPFTSTPLPVPPPSQSSSEIAYWNRGDSPSKEIEALRVMAIIRPLLPYVTFTPRPGRGGWDARPAGFKGSNDLGWGYANTLDILDDLVADLSLFQPNMSRCVAIDPSSNIAVNNDVAQHLRGFHRSAQLLLQYALEVARTITMSTVRAYNPAVFSVLNSSAAGATSPRMTTVPRRAGELLGPPTMLMTQSFDSGRSIVNALSTDQLVASTRVRIANLLAQMSSE